ncbi:uncharacterized protein MICPUCDRAFT_33798, partial [Micromonas pusilla CCMP1545]
GASQRGHAQAQKRHGETPQGSNGRRVHRPGESGGSARAREHAVQRAEVPRGGRRVHRSDQAQPGRSSRLLQPSRVLHEARRVQRSDEGCGKVHRARADVREGVHAQGPRGVLHEAVRQGAGDVPSRPRARPEQRRAEGRLATRDGRDPKGQHRAGERGGDERASGARDGGPGDSEHPSGPGDASGSERLRDGSEGGGGAPEEPGGDGEGAEAHQRGRRAGALIRCFDATRSIERGDADADESTAARLRRSSSSTVGQTRDVTRNIFA